jgi:hypothetical protein
MAFRFKTREKDAIYFPTLHVHDGELHERADFDHALFYQAPAGAEAKPASDLLLRSLRRKAGILSSYLFHRPESSHLAATYFCTNRGLVVAEGGAGEPAFSIRNPRSKDLAATDYVPFLAHVTF